MPVKLEKINTLAIPKLATTETNAMFVSFQYTSCAHLFLLRACEVEGEQLCGTAACE